MLVPRIPSCSAREIPPVQTETAQGISIPNWNPASDTLVSFEIRHDGTAIYLAYKVSENAVRAVNTGYNNAVWEDSCVEFFLAIPGEHNNYYNFEFNAIGALLGAYGPDRHQREWIDPDILSDIEVSPSLGLKPFDVIAEPTTWTLNAKIPVAVLLHSGISNLSGLNATANFYKCGDKLPEPHFLSWKRVDHPVPDFHQPAHFGGLSFQ